MRSRVRSATVQREWKKGDVIEMTIPTSVRTEPLHGSSDQFAFVYGPVVLAGDLGPAPAGSMVPYAKEQQANLEGGIDRGADAGRSSAAAGGELASRARRRAGVQVNDRPRRAGK